MELNGKQKEKLAAIKVKLQDILEPNHEDAHIIRFLVARRFDVKQAEQMFRKDAEWRKENKIDTILTWYEIPEVFKTNWLGGISGLDKTGHVIYIMDIGSFDPRGMLHSAKSRDLQMTNIYHLEDLVKQARQITTKSGRPVYGATIIMDVENVGIHHLWKPGIDQLLKGIMILEQHYPELVYRLYFVKAAKIFPLIYSLVKPFLREDSRKKLKVLGGNWKEELLKVAEPDQLPVFWGGTKTDPDGNEKCASLIKLPSKIDKSFYLKGREPKFTMTSCEVSRGGNIEFKYDVSKPDSVLRYEFQTGSGDIKFGFDRVDDNGKRTPIIKLQKHNCHMVPEDDEILLQEPGTYIARFENDSWTKSKKLSYWLELLEPTEEEPAFEEMAEDFTRLDIDD